MSFFSALSLYHQRDSSRSAALNMAIDEALLESAQVPIMRFYQWDHPALSFGYFGKFQDIAQHSDRDVVRRWTGGGTVFHGEDLTYSIVIPANDLIFKQSAMSIYEKVHHALRASLAHDGQRGELWEAHAASGADYGTSPKCTDKLRDPEDATGPSQSSVTTRGACASQMCFGNPVRADVMLNGRKIAGAAQRRTKKGLLQQGSIQGVDLPCDFPMRFARELSTHVTIDSSGDRILQRAHDIACQKYATQRWLRRC